MALDVAAAAHGVFGLGELDRPAADVHVAVADGIADAWQSGMPSACSRADRQRRCTA